MSAISRVRAASIVLAVAATMLVAPAADAAVARSVTVKATPKAALKNTKVTFSGVLSKSPKGSTVKVQRKSGTKWVNVKATTTTTRAGAWSVKVALPATAGNYRFRSFAPPKPGLKAATSTPITVTALRRTTFFRIGGSGPQFVLLSANKGQPSAASGSLNKIYTAGAKVVVQRNTGGATPWTTLGTGAIATNGTFNVPFPNAQSGQYRVVVSRKGLNSGATSAIQSYVFLP